MRTLSAIVLGAYLLLPFARAEEPIPAAIPVIPGLTQEHSFAPTPAPKSDPGTLSFMYYPLMDKLGNMSIRQVPVIIYGRSPSNLIEALRAPVFVASENAEDRVNDINLVRLAKIGIKTKIIEGGEGDILIDVTWAERPAGAKADLADVVEAIITCLRYRLEQGIGHDLNVRIIGASPIDPVWEKLQGSLWHSN